MDFSVAVCVSVFDPTLLQSCLFNDSRQNLQSLLNDIIYPQKQSPRSVLGKWFSENMQQIYRRTPMSKCDFNKVAEQLY